MLNKVALATSLAILSTPNLAQEQRSPAQNLDTFEKLFALPKENAEITPKVFALKVSSCQPIVL